MNRRQCVASLAAPFIPLQAAAKRPNVVLLLADDMGLRDASCQGGAIPTPNIDRLAAQGVRFKNFYSASATCSPSRAAILTGRYPLRFDIRRAFTDDEAHLPVVPSIPSLLKRAGYATGHVGKWHLGGLHLKHIRERATSIPGPHQHGFDHYQTQREEQPMRREMGDARILFRKGGTCLLRNDKEVPENDPYFHKHFEDVNGDESVRLIDEFHRRGGPFFLNVWFLAPHKPYEPAPEPFWTKADAPGISEDRRCFRSMVMHMDHQVGRILRRLEELEIRDNTLVVFTSDNGGAFESDIGPYKGGKTDLHEGGIRVPGILSWPAQIREPGRSTEQVAHHCDLLPTIAAASGVTVAGDAPVDGIDLMPMLEPGSAAIERTLFWQHDLMPRIQRHSAKPKPYATEAVRRGRWKMLLADGKPMALYDLDADPIEENDLLGSKPEVEHALASFARASLTEKRDRRGFRTLRPAGA
jgi:N-acetylgalactosamine-6-sulfatase